MKRTLDSFVFFRKIWNPIWISHFPSSGLTPVPDHQLAGYHKKFVSLVFAGAALPDHVGSARNKLLSLILFLVWIITGLVCISRMSYNKFFLLMSSTFLVHAFFGPVWCLRRLAFCVGVCMWMGSLVSNKPIPAAITVLVAFTLTGLRKWRKKVAMTTKTSDLLKLNESLEQRLDGIEKKLDVLVSKLNVICGSSS